MVWHGRVVYCCALVALAWFQSPAAARDPDWYEDIQYLTWDVRADEAEAARAAGVHGEVFLQPSPQEQELGWYASCGNEQSRLTAMGTLPRQLVGAFQQLVGASAAKGRAIFKGDANRAAQSDECATTYTALRPVAISDRLVR